MERFVATCMERIRYIFLSQFVCSCTHAFISVQVLAVQVSRGATAQAQQWGRCLMTINVRFAAESGMEDMLWMASVSRFVQMATFLAFGSKLCIAAFRQSRIVATCIHKLGIHLAVSVVRRSSSLLSSSRPRPVLGKDPTTRSHLADPDHDQDASCSYCLQRHPSSHANPWHCIMGFDEFNSGDKLKVFMQGKNDVSLFYV